MSLGREDLEHKDRNQANYNEKANEHDTLGLKSTLYLAYRDVNELLERHLYPKLTDKKIRILDFGCGAGLSIETILHQIKGKSSYKVDVFGVDINAANIEIAKSKMPGGTFKCISNEDNFDDMGKFDLIICNFVLVEMKSSEMLSIVKLLKSKLNENGILIVTNPTARAYRPENKWYTFNTEFCENIPSRQLDIQKKLKFHEDQSIKIQVFAAKDSEKSFTFFDFFHSGSAYRNVYKAAGLKLLESHKPVGMQEDKIAWHSEFSKPPYKIHVLGK